MKYWVYLNGEVPGCYEPLELASLADFSRSTFVCPAEGEIAEKNWRRAGEVPEILQILRDSETGRSRTAAKPDPPVVPGDVNAFIDSSGAKIFRHVSRLVKELEDGREERNRISRLEGQILELNAQIESLRREGAEKEARIGTEGSKIRELESFLERERHDKKVLEDTIAKRQSELGSIRIEVGRLKADEETLKKRLGESQNDLAIRNRLVSKLSLELTEKELHLAKSLGIIRKLEENLAGLSQNADREAPKALKAARDLVPPDPPSPPASRQAEGSAAAGNDQNLAQKALMDRLKKLVRPK